VTVEIGILIGIGGLALTFGGYMAARLTDAKKQGALEQRVTDLEKRVDKVDLKTDKILEKLDAIASELQTLIAEHRCIAGKDCT
jgi:hypothetical protein